MSKDHCGLWIFGPAWKVLTVGLAVLAKTPMAVVAIAGCCWPVGLGLGFRVPVSGATPPPGHLRGEKKRNNKREPTFCQPMAKLVENWWVEIDSIFWSSLQKPGENPHLESRKIIANSVQSFTFVGAWDVGGASSPWFMLWEMCGGLSATCSAASQTLVATTVRAFFRRSGAHFNPAVPKLRINRVWGRWGDGVLGLGWVVGSLGFCLGQR